jgi:hypothetical protein
MAGDALSGWVLKICVRGTGLSLLLVHAEIFMSPPNDGRERYKAFIRIIRSRVQQSRWIAGW